MKKSFIIVIFILFIIPCFAYDKNRPEWKDFCPFGYENANEYDNSKSLAGTDKHWKIKEYNYWVSRKKSFEDDLSKCDELNAEDRKACYEKLTVREERLNQTTITPLQEWQNRQNQWKQAGQSYMMYDAIKNKNYNINGNTNHNINGNIRYTNY